MPDESSQRSESFSDRSLESDWADQDARPVSEEPEMSALLDAVLRETIVTISDEEAHELIAGWLNGHPKGEALDVEEVRSLARHILERRFRSWHCPEEELGKLAQWLWEDPMARARLECLWNEASSP